MSETPIEKPKTDAPKAKSSRNMHAMLLVLIGVIVIVAGAAVITVRGNPLRGSGAGTALVILGFFMMAIAVLRLYYKRS